MACRFSFKVRREGRSSRLRPGAIAYHSKIDEHPASRKHGFVAGRNGPEEEETPP